MPPHLVAAASYRNALSKKLKYREGGQRFSEKDLERISVPLRSIFNHSVAPWIGSLETRNHKHVNTQGGRILKNGAQLGKMSRRQPGKASPQQKKKRGSSGNLLVNVQVYCARARVYPLLYRNDVLDHQRTKWPERHVWKILFIVH